MTILVGSMLSLLALPTMAEKVTITFLGGGHESVNVVCEEVINRILAKENPEIKFEYWKATEGFDAKLATMIAAGAAPDLAQMHPSNTNNMGDQGVFMSIEDFLKADPTFDKDDFLPNLRDAFTYKGDLIAVPWLAFPWIFYYNMDEFDEMGLSYPDASWTWRGQFLDAAKKLTRDIDGNGTIDVFGFNSGLSTTRVKQFLLADGGNMWWSADGKRCVAGEPGTYEPLQFLQDLEFKYNVRPTAEQYAGTHPLYFFLGGRSAMYYSGFFVFERVKNGMAEAGTPWGIAPLPLGTVGRNQSYEGWSVGIPPFGKHLEEAWEVAKLFARPEMVKANLLMYYSLGTSKGITEPGNELNSFLFEEYGKIMSRESVQVLVDGMNDIVPIPMPTFTSTPELEQALGLLGEMWQSVLYDGDRSAKEACIEASAVINELLAKIEPE